MKKLKLRTKEPLEAVIWDGEEATAVEFFEGSESRYTFFIPGGNLRVVNDDDYCGTQSETASPGDVLVKGCFGNIAVYSMEGVENVYEIEEAPEDIWQAGGEYVLQPLEIVSSSSEEIGTVVKFDGVDQNGAPISGAVLYGGEPVEIGGKIYSCAKAVADEIERLRALCGQAAATIEENWEALCDDEGYGPCNCLRRLKEAAAKEASDAGND